MNRTPFYFICTLKTVGLRVRVRVMVRAGGWVRNYVFISDGVIQGDNMKRFCLRKAAEFECL